MTITKLQNGDFKVETGTPMSDGSFLVGICGLRNNELSTQYAKGHGIVISPVRVLLGPLSLCKVSHLPVGETFSATNI